MASTDRTSLEYLNAFVRIDLRIDCGQIEYVEDARYLLPQTPCDRRGARQMVERGKPNRDGMSRSKH